MMDGIIVGDDNNKFRLVSLKSKRFEGFGMMGFLLGL